jgi:hypothetical protein
MRNEMTLEDSTSFILNLSATLGTATAPDVTPLKLTK